MRYIDIELLQPSKKWKGKAASKLAELESTPLNDRKSFWEKNPIWQEIKDDWQEKTFDKCWYSESPIEGGYNPVEHFRPKASVVAHKAFNKYQIKNDGYGHCSYCWRNYRISCQICNSGITKDEASFGKKNYFPTFNSGMGCWDEKAVLLDPTKAEDVNLLDFSSDGKCCCHSSVPEDAERVEASAIILGLDYYKFKDNRRDVVSTCNQLVSEGDDFVLEYPKGLIKLAEKINNLTDRKSKYSAIAIRTLKLLATKRKWLYEIVKGLEL